MLLRDAGFSRMRVLEYFDKHLPRTILVNSYEYDALKCVFNPTNNQQLSNDMGFFVQGVLICLYRDAPPFEL
jgi:hypothetical protein